MPNRYAQQIAELVSVPDVLQRYGYPLGRGRRIPCPIHQGQDANFCYTDRVYHCWSCGASGDAIRLVMELFGLPLGQAIVKINSDFALGLSLQKPTRRELEMERKRRALQEECRKEERRQLERYLKLCGLYATLFRVFLSGADIDGLKEYLDRLEDYLDAQVEGGTQ